MKRRHLLLMALSLILSICMCFGLAACSSCDDDDEPTKLSTPVVTIDNTGVASWLEVENASGYAYVIGDGAETATTKLSVQLTDGQTIKVKAKGDGTNYSDSDFSETKTYTAPAAQPTKLDTPQVSIGADGTVTIGSVEHAVKIVYVIGDGAETEYDANNKPVLEDGQKIKVTAKGDGTNYSDSDQTSATYTKTPAKVMTHAAFMAAEKDSDVIVQGVVTIVSGKNVYFQDKDGGYYAYSVAEVPANLAVGMTVKVAGKKDVYYGLNQVKSGGTLEIVDTQIKDASPVDITEAVKNMTSLSDLDTYQNMLVVVKGITLAAFDGSNFKFTLGTVEVSHYVGGKYQLVAQADQDAYKKLFADNAGKTADLTCVVGATTKDNAVVSQLVPASTNPLSNIKATLTKLKAPTVSVDPTTGIATFNKADGVSYVYKIGENGTATPVPENGEIQLTAGDTVYVMAKGDGEATSDSDWSVGKTYTGIDPSTLPALDAPETVTVAADGTFSWTAVEGAAGYAYVIGDGTDVEVNAETLSVTNAPLAAGQIVKVKALGNMTTHKDSEYAQATYIKKLPAPQVEISLAGVVTVTADANATKVVYVKGTDAEADYDAANKPVLANGEKITVTAKGDGNAYADSDPVEKTYTEVAVMTHAEYMDAETGATVAVTGVVTAFRGKNVYFQDTDGGYYLYGSGKNDTTVIPVNLEVGMTVKVVGKKAEYNGLIQVTNATVEITNETIATVTPVDITTVVTDMTSLDALADYMNSLVIVHGITVDEFDGGNFKFTLGTVEVPMWVGGTSQIIDGDGQTAFKNAFSDNIGKTGDLTCFVSATKQSNVVIYQLIPANTTPLSNLQGAAVCADPQVKISDSGLATWEAVTGAVKYVYKVNDGEAQEILATATLEVQLSNNDFIVVQAVGDGTDYTDSGWSAKKTYRVFSFTAGSLVKANNTTALKVGDVIVITNSDGSKTLKDAAKANNRDETAFDKDHPSDEVTYIILEQGTKENTFAMRTKLGYLYASSSSSNYLVFKEDPDADCDWSITINADGVATITCQGQFTNNKLQYNKNSKIFSCYSTTQGSVCVYVNVKATKLKTPTITIDDDGFVTIGNIDENAKKVVYHIGNDEEDHTDDNDYDANNKPQLNNGQTINVTVKGDNVYYESSFNKKTYTETPVQLLAPTVEIDGATGLVMITATGDAEGNFTDKVTGYQYTVYSVYVAGDEESSTAIITDKAYDPDVDEDIFLEDGQWIKVKTIGQRRYKDSAYGEPVQFEEDEVATAIPTPTMSVDKDGYVSFSATKGSGYTYQIKKASEENFGEPVTVAKAANNQPLKLTTALEDGDTIKVKANKIATEELQLDSEWSETPLTYQAPSERTDVPTDFAFTKVENEVKLTFTAASGVEYKISLNGGDAVAVNDGEHSFAIEAYTSISLIVVGDAPAGSLTSGDFHTYFKDKTLDLKEAYETTFFNAYKVSTVRAEVEALSPDTIPASLEDDKIITLPVAGTAYADISIDWTITEGENASYAYKSEDGKTLTIKPSLASATFTLKLQAVVNGDNSAPIPFTIEVVKSNAVKFNFSGTTASTTAYSNTALLTDLNKACKTNPNFTGLQSFTQLYPHTDSLRVGSGNNKGTLVLNFSQNIEKVVINFGQYGTDASTLTVNGKTIDTPATAADQEILITTASTTLTIESSKRCCVYSIAVHLKPLGESDMLTIAEEAIKSSTLTPTIAAGVYTYNLPLKGEYDATIAWNVTGLTGDDNYDPATGKLTVKQRADEATITAKATVTVGDTSSTEASKPVKEIKVPSSNSASELAVFDMTTTGHTAYTFTDSAGNALTKATDYTTTWYAAKGDLKWTIANIQNNNWGWDNIRAGRKSNSSVASITTTLTGKVTSVVITIDALTKALNTKDTIKLIVLNGDTEVKSVDVTDQFGSSAFNTAKTITATIPALEGTNYTYKFEMNLAATGSNGSIQISKIVYKGYAA